MAALSEVSYLLSLLLLLLLLLSLSAATQACPPGFNSTLGRCLLLNLTANVTWCDANRACADLGAELLTNWTVIDSANTTIPGINAWIGVSDLAHERATNKDGWLFVNGRGVMPTSTPPWIPDDPNNPAQDCVMLKYKPEVSVSAMIDKECDYYSNVGYVCELPDVSPTVNCGGSSAGGVGGGRIRWTPAPPPPQTSDGVPNDLNRYCYWEKSDVLSLRDCAMLAGFRTYSRSFLYSKEMKKCHVTEFSDSQTQLEQNVTMWVKYVKG